MVDDYIGTQFVFKSREQNDLQDRVYFKQEVNNNNDNKGFGKSMVKYLKNVSFVANSIYLQFKRKIICKNYIKYFAYKLSNCLVNLSFITSFTFYNNS